MSGRVDWTELLHQDQVWVNATGRTVELADMDRRYCQNVHAHLLRNASGYLEQAHLKLLQNPPLSDEAADAVLAELERADSDPIDWIRQTPLVRALEWRMEEEGLTPPDHRSMLLVVRLEVPKTKGSGMVRRSVERALRGLPYDSEVVSLENERR